MSAITQINHSEYMERVKWMTEAQLRYVIKDCQQAIQAFPEGPKSSYYQDEICYCGMELARRRRELEIILGIKKGTAGLAPAGN